MLTEGPAVSTPATIPADMRERFIGAFLALIGIAAGAIVAASALYVDGTHPTLGRPADHSRGALDGVGEAGYLAPALVREFKAIGGARATVACTGTPGRHGAWGVAWLGGEKAELDPKICALVNRAVSRRRPHPASFASAQNGLALGVLVHEAVHLGFAAAGDWTAATDEAQTECRSLQLVYELARRLGAPEQHARAWAAWNLDWSQRLGRRHPDYAPVGCYDGGPLDIKPEAVGWPSP